MNARAIFAASVLAGVALNFVGISDALDVKASPPTCRYGGDTCLACDEFEVVPPRRPDMRSRSRCVKCVLDKSKPACVSKYF